MNILFEKCWVGVYVGDGQYEGGSCPDILVTNITEDDIDTDDLFDMYLELDCGTSCQEEKIFKVKELKTKCRRKEKPVKITKREELSDCCKSFIEIDYTDLCNWYTEEML